MQVGFYGHTRQYHNIKAEIDANIAKVLESGEYVHGPMNKQFEKEFAAFSGTKYSIPCGNGTDALWLTLMALGIGKGDEVITNANTFFATAEAIWIAGATVVLVDCCPKTKNLCPTLSKRRSRPAPAASCRCICTASAPTCRPSRRSLTSTSSGSSRTTLRPSTRPATRSRSASCPDAVATSFIIQKNLGCFGDGGAIVTNNEQINKVTRLLRAHGSPARNVHSFGFNSRLDDIQAGILSAKLKVIHALNDQRIKWAARYTEGLKGAKSFDLPYATPGYRHVWHLYVIETKRPQDRDAMVKFLNENGVDAKTHYSIAIHKQAGYPWGKDARVCGPVANAEANAACCVSLPMFPELTAAEVDYVIEVCKKWEKAHPEACMDGPGAARVCTCCKDK